jgi:hypothetical protein
MKVDMSPEAVTARLRLASQLNRLRLSLGKAVPVNRPTEEPAVADAPTNYERPLQSTDEFVKRNPSPSLQRNKPIDPRH